MIVAALFCFIWVDCVFGFVAIGFSFGLNPVIKILDRVDLFWATKNFVGLLIMGGRSNFLHGDKLHGGSFCRPMILIQRFLFLLAGSTNFVVSFVWRYLAMGFRGWINLHGKVFCRLVISIQRLMFFLAGPTYFVGFLIWRYVNSPSKGVLSFFFVGHPVSFFEYCWATQKAHWMARVGLAGFLLVNGWAVYLEDVSKAKDFSCGLILGLYSMGRASYFDRINLFVRIMEQLWAQGLACVGYFYVYW